MILNITMRACILLYILAILTGSTNSRSCIASINTYRLVQSCPTTEADVKERARIKDCDSFAKSQNCTAPSRFKYHCVIDVWETALIEVCAPAYFMLGYCTEYNIQGARIQDHYDRRCTNYSPPCPTRYISTDAYKFPGCYEVVKKQEELTTSINDIVEDQISFVWIAAVPAIIPIIIAIIFVCYLRRRGEENLSMEERPIESEISQPFTKLRVLDKIIQTLNFKGYVVIKGDRGDGKTVLAQHAIAEMKRDNGKESLNITESEKWDKLVPIHNDHVIFIDNMFGDAIPLDVTQWSNILRSMKAMVAESTNRNCVIITLRSKVFKQICLEEGIKDFLEDAMLDISVEGMFHLTHQEKKQLQNRRNF